MDDLISRQAAIDATWEEPSYTDPLNVLTEVRDRIKALPPTQPESLVNESRPLVKDTISRQAAIDALDKRFDGVPMELTTEILQLRRDLSKLPSTQSVLTCDGCRHVGTYDTDFPCSGCIRREKDYYEQER